jgi:parallel beta-helix repeat protein
MILRITHEIKLVTNSLFMSGPLSLVLNAILIVQFFLLVTLPIPFQNASSEIQRRDYLVITDRDIIVEKGVWTLQKLIDNYPSAFEVISVKNSSNGAGNSSTVSEIRTIVENNKKNVVVLMRNPLVIDKHASLNISDAHLFLESFPSKDIFPVRILVRGEAIIENSTIDSLIKAQNIADRNPLHPRPFIAAVDEGVLNIRNATIKHLGFSLGGISSLAAVNYFETKNFEIKNSTFEYDYHGFYSDNSSDFHLRGNTFYGNTGYGIDPHTGSRNFLIDSNHVSLSGKQGIICSFLCYNVTITNNIVEEGTEGVGLHWLTNSSKIQNNIIRNNEQFGIFIKNFSINNVIEGNIVANNGCSIGLFEGANENTIVDNTIVDIFASQRYCDNYPIYSDNLSKSNNIGRNTLIIDHNSSNHSIKAESIKNYDPQNVVFEKYSKSFLNENKSGLINIEFEHPGDWQRIIDNSHNVIVKFLASSGSNADDNNSSTHRDLNSTATFTIEAQSFDDDCEDCSPASLDVAIYRIVENVLGQNQSMEVIRSEPTSISGMPAHRIILLQTNDIEDLTGYRIVEIHALDENSKMHYTIRFQADNQTYARNLLVLDEVIKSMSLSSRWLQ